MKPTIKLDKKDISQRMWDNWEGHFVLAVAPDGSDHAIHWASNNRQWNPWPKGWLTIGIPPLDPEGSGKATEDAEYLLLDVLKLAPTAIKLIEAEDIGWVEAAERLAPEHWATAREEAIDWLLEAFLDACNGFSDLGDPQPWGTQGDLYAGDLEIIQPPANFEWVDDNG